jgi:hypothetical protein
MNGELEMVLEGSGLSLIEVLSWHLHERNKDNKKKLWTGFK